MQNQPITSTVDEDETVREGLADLLKSMEFIAGAFQLPEMTGREA